MSFVGHGWRSGQASDTTGGVTATTTVSSLSTPTAARTAAPFAQTVTGSGFTASSIIYANYAPIATVFVDATHVRCDKFNPKPDSGVAGTIPIGVRNSGEKLSSTINFTAT